MLRLVGHSLLKKVVLLSEHKMEIFMIKILLCTSNENGTHHLETSCVKLGSMYALRQQERTWELHRKSSTSPSGNHKAQEAGRSPQAPVKFPRPFLLHESMQGAQFYTGLHLTCTLKIISQKKEVLKHATMWISLEKVMLIENSGTQKSIYCVVIVQFHLYDMSRIF